MAPPLRGVIARTAVRSEQRKIVLAIHDGEPDGYDACKAVVAGSPALRPWAGGPGVLVWGLYVANSIVKAGTEQWLDDLFGGRFLVGDTDLLAVQLANVLEALSA